MPALFSSKDVERLKEFLNVEGKRILIYHRDADGIASAALLLKFFPDFEPIPRKGPKMDESFLKTLIKKDPFLVVFLDIPVDQEIKSVRFLESKLPSCRFVIIDHHIIENNMNSSNILHINPRFKLKNSYIPVSYVMYRLLGSLGFDVKKHIWISIAGIIGDHAYNECSELLRECEKIYPGFIGINIETSKAKGITDLVSAAIANKGFKGASEILKIFTKAEGIEDLEKNEPIAEMKREIDNEVKKLLKDFNEKKEENGILVSYRIETRYNLSPTISGLLSEKNPEKIILVYKKSEGGWKISLRYQKGGINLGSIVKKCLGPEDSGGGHEKAAGGIIKDIKGFKERLSKEIKNKLH